MNIEQRYTIIDVDDYGRKHWNNLVDLHGDGRPYAYEWYLDQVTNKNWIIIVDRDTSNMMPVAISKKYKIFNHPTRPILCQQLGPLLPEENSDHWIYYLIKKYKFINYPLHEGCQISHPSHDNRTNLVLDLSEPNYFDRFSKSLRKRLRKCEDMLEISTPSSADQVINEYFNNMADIVSIKSSDKLKIQNLFIELERRNLLLLKSILYKGVTVASGAFIVTHRRVINIFGSSTETGKRVDAMHYLLYHVMSLFSGKEMLFDFEGSDIKGVKSFFMRFNPSIRTYPHVKR